MLQVTKFTFNPFQENTYIISDENKHCWIIDPGMSSEDEETELSDFIVKKSLQPQAIINTHAHIDHVLGIDYIADKYKVPFYLHELELSILKNAANTAKMFGFQFKGVNAKPLIISEREHFQLGKTSIQIKLVPGHSPGSIALYAATENWMISGDALFKESIGRTDLPMGNHNQLINSIKTELFTLPEETIVYSGHGQETTIKHEKANNPFLRN